MGAQRQGQIIMTNPYSEAGNNAVVGLVIAVQDRTNQKTADCYANGDRKRLARSCRPFTSA